MKEGRKRGGREEKKGKRKERTQHRKSMRSNGLPRWDERLGKHRNQTFANSWAQQTEGL